MHSVSTHDEELGSPKGHSLVSARGCPSRDWTRVPESGAELKLPPDRGLLTIPWNLCIV